MNSSINNNIAEQLDEKSKKFLEYESYTESSNGNLYTNSNYSDNFFSELRSLFITSKFTDVILICDDNDSTSEDDRQDDEKLTSNYIPCHKIVLSAFSPYFKAMFSSNLIETKTNKVRMSDTDFATLNDIINYAYCGSIYLNVNNIQNIFSLASILQVRDLVNACSDFMIANLDLQNCIDVFQFSKRYLNDQLTEKSTEYINRNFNEILKSQEFLNINDVNLLVDLIQNDDLDIESEDILLIAILKWIEFNYEQRKDHLEKLIFETIRFNLLDTSHLSELLSSYRFLIKSERFVGLVNDLLSDDIERSSIEKKYDVIFDRKKRAGMSKSQYCFLLIGGNCDLDDGFYVNCFNPFNGEKYFLSRSFIDKKNQISKGFFHIENPGVCVTEDNRIFVAGGNYVYHEYKIFNKRSKSSTSNISTYKNSKNVKKKLDYQEFVSLYDESTNLKDGDEILSKELHEYDNLNDTWIRRSNMLFSKSNFTLCSMNGKIYSFGGITKDADQLDIVECYDISENKWKYVCTMPAPFIAGAVVAYEDCFYVMGGRSGVGRFNNCYAFNPTSLEWSDIRSMNVGRFNFGACVYKDKIYVFGGQRYNESEQNYFTREALDSVEIYDLKGTQQWCFGKPLPSSLYNTGVCVYDYDEKCIYLCGTTECKYSGNTLFGFMFTSVFRLEFLDENVNNHKEKMENNGEIKTMKWSVVEHDVSDIKSNYRCVSAKLNTRKIHKCQTDISVPYSTDNI